MKSAGEMLMAVHLSEIPDTEWVSEHVFHPSRKWRYDFAELELMIAVEVEGGTWNGGRHVTGKGFEEDAEKYAAAAALGWQVVRVTTKAVLTGRAKTAVAEVVALYRARKRT